jgi:hypothetical protein
VLDNTGKDVSIKSSEMLGKELSLILGNEFLNVVELTNDCHDILSQLAEMFTLLDKSNNRVGHGDVTISLDLVPVSAFVDDLEEVHVEVTSELAFVSLLDEGVLLEAFSTLLSSSSGISLSLSEYGNSEFLVNCISVTHVFEGVGPFSETDVGDVAVELS